MVEMALPDNFQGSEPLLVSYNIRPNQLIATGSSAAVFIETGPERIYRIRYVNIIGGVSGTAGTATLTFEALTSGDTPAGWPQVGPLATTAPHTFALGENFSLTWSTEVADNYSGTNQDWGTTMVMGLPLVFIPAGCFVQLLCSPSAGGDAEADIQGGLIQYESFPPGALQGDNAQGQDSLYLLPGGG